MAYWLFKSEPSTWSWDAQKARGARGEPWEGVRNYQARNNMRAMKLGDLGFFYHSNQGLEIVGIVEVSKLIHPDATSDDSRWECVDIKAVRNMPQRWAPWECVRARRCPRGPDRTARRPSTKRAPS